MFLNGDPGEVKDISPIVMTGFTSQKRCLDAASVMATKLIPMGNNSRRAAGLATDADGKGSPNIDMECTMITK